MDGNLETCSLLQFKRYLSLISGFLFRLQVFKTATYIFVSVLLFQLRDVLSSSQSFKVGVLPGGGGGLPYEKDGDARRLA